jgi:hypothetical protein
MKSNIAFKIIFLPIDLQGRETWIVKIRGEFRLRVIEENTVRGIFGMKRHEAIGCWRKLDNQEVRNLYCSLNKISIMKLNSMR